MGDRNIPNMTKLGPAGALTGGVFFEGWDEKGRTEIVQIIVGHNESTVVSIQFLYYEQGNLVLSNLFGKPHAPKSHVVKLNYPSEYITCVSGEHICTRVDSIKFTTNKKTYGPFGETADSESEVDGYCFFLGNERAFGGFFGSTDRCGLSIGVYLKLPTTLNLEENNTNYKKVTKAER